jgi:hypothetical protein
MSDVLDMDAHLYAYQISDFKYWNSDRLYHLVSENIHASYFYPYSPHMWVDIYWYDIYLSFALALLVQNFWYLLARLFW